MQDQDVLAQVRTAIFQRSEIGAKLDKIADLIAQREAKPKGKAKKSETREEPQQTGFDRQESPPEE